MSSSKHRWTTIAALSAAVFGAQLTPAIASADLHNVTYVARVDGIAPGSTATFLINDNQTSTTNLSSLGNSFEANTVLADPTKAGLQVAVHFPYSANVHCEIDVDDNVATQLDQVVKPTQNNNDPANGVLACGAPLPPS
ncbi:MAG: hypothetical protein WA317_00860 [Mycobacterium sp.]|uniref:hypothetical protein n=1 Tax=Mycobacterium sp. TaxID=1785 RepID=UPI003CC6DA68